MPSITGKLFQECIKISNTEVARKQFLSLTFLVDGFTAVCAQGFAFLYYWNVPVSKLSFSLRVKQAPAALQSTVLWGCCRAVTAALLAHITQGRHLLTVRLGNHGAARWKGRFYSKLSFRIQTGTWNWLKRTASLWQSACHACNQKSPGKAMCETAQVMQMYLHPTASSSCWGSWILGGFTGYTAKGSWLVSQEHWVLLPAAMACYLS